MKIWYFLIFTFIIAACATSPTGRSQLMIVSPQEAINASQEAYYQTLKPLAKAGKIDNDPEIKSRVRYITGKIISQAVELFPETQKWHWSVRVIDEPEATNAWCMAGGKMAIYTGFIEKLQPTDDELAQVMGHEIAHAISHHTAEKMSVAMASQLGINTVAIVTGGNNGDNSSLASAVLAATMAIELPNSRRAEEEADRIGIELAARSGFNPYAAVSLWQKMSQANSQDLPEFISTHPNAISRIATLKRLAPLMMPYYLEEHPRPVYVFKH